MASGNAEGFAIYNEHSDDELLACLHQIASKNRALKKAEGEPVPPVEPEELKIPTSKCLCAWRLYLSFRTKKRRKAIRVSGVNRVVAEP